jgi:DNA-binding response OmpR family regulator
MADTSGLILVVDDNEMNRDMLARRLERQNHQVLMAENGVRALELLNEQNIDLVLLDVQMPKMTGYEVLEHMKNDAKLKPIPVIMISAVDDLDSVVKCIELGAEDYLFKPFNPVLLRARVAATLDKRRAAASEDPAHLKAALTPVIELILNDASVLAAGEYGALSDDQRGAVERILTRAREAAEALGTFGTPK